MGGRKPHRPRASQAPAPPPPSGFADEINRIARQVRIDLARRGTEHPPTVHLLSRAWTASGGRTYRTRCAALLTAAQGAILTTHEATCERCVRGGR